MERSPELAARDVAEGLVSREVAQRVYGVGVVCGPSRLVGGELHFLARFVGADTESGVASALGPGSSSLAESWGGSAIAWVLLGCVLLDSEGPSRS